MGSLTKCQSSALEAGQANALQWSCTVSLQRNQCLHDELMAFDGFHISYQLLHCGLFYASLFQGASRSKLASWAGSGRQTHAVMLLLELPKTMQHLDPALTLPEMRPEKLGHLPT